jgi:hypothetical protein
MKKKAPPNFSNHLVTYFLGLLPPNSRGMRVFLQSHVVTGDTKGHECVVCKGIVSLGCG